MSFDNTKEEASGATKIALTSELQHILIDIAPDGIDSGKKLSLSKFIFRSLKDSGTFICDYLTNTIGYSNVRKILETYENELSDNKERFFTEDDKLYAFNSAMVMSNRVLSSFNFLLMIMTRYPNIELVTTLKKHNISIAQIIDEMRKLTERIKDTGGEGVLAAGVAEDDDSSSETTSVESMFFAEYDGIDEAFVSIKGELTNKIINTINKKIDRNVIVVGDRGVGKTSLVAELVERIKDKNCPYELRGSRIITTVNSILFPASKAVQLTIDPGIITQSLESFGLKKILVIDDMEDLLQCDEHFPKLLLTYCEENGIPVIGLCDSSKYDQLCRNYDLHYYQKFTMEKPTYEETNLVLSSLRNMLEKVLHHKIEGLDNHKIIELADTYIRDTSLPGSAINLLDHTLSKLIVDSETSPDLVRWKGELKLANQLPANNKANATIKQEKIQSLERLITDESRRLRKIKVLHIDNNIIFNVLSEITGLEINYFNNDMHSKLLTLEENLNKVIVGQEEAVREVSRSVKRGKLGLGRDNKPRGVFLFVAPSGVGKTYLAKCLANEMYGSENDIIRIDMSEHINKESINTLIGSARGYIGSEEGGMLTKAVKKNPNSIILLDEFEKACDEVMNLFLQVFDDGRLTDGLGETVDFKNTFIILTSNIGTKEADTNKSIGFGATTDAEKQKRHREIIEKEIRKRLKPELLNRFDKIVYFKDLEKNDYIRISRLELDKACQRCAKIGYNLTYDDGVVEVVSKMKGNEMGAGARPILRNIETMVEDQLTDTILTNSATKAFFATVNDDNEVIVKPN